MQKTFSSICPITNSKQSIDVDYKSYSPLGSTETYYTKSTFSCSNLDCNHENCPLYNNAPISF